MGAVGFMGETVGAKGRGEVGGLASEKANWLLVVPDASAALVPELFNNLGLRISKICCLLGAVGRLRSLSCCKLLF